MPQTWWCLHISYSLISSSSHFSKCQCRCPHSCASSHFHEIEALGVMVREASTFGHQLLQKALGCEVYDVFMYFFFLHYVAQILDWCWCRILFITCSHDSLLDLMWNILCYVLVVITIHVMLWDSLLYAVGILLLSSCMFFLTSLLCDVGGMFIMHVSVSY